MIVNAHAHIGESRVFEHDFPEQALISGMDKYGIDVSIVQPAIGPESYQKYHDDIADAAARYPGRIAGMTAFSPQMDPDDYFAEVERCVKELGFVAIKLHPLEMAVDPLSADGRVTFEAASAFGVPLMVHTGLGSPFAGPAKLIPRAREFPQLPIIMAHAGLIVYTHEAMVAAEICPNLYFEPSWCSYYLVQEMIEKFGSNRVMIGGDHILNFPLERLKIEILELDDEDHGNVMGETARRVFKLDEKM